MLTISTSSTVAFRQGATAPPQTLRRKSGDHEHTAEPLLRIEDEQPRVTARVTASVGRPATFSIVTVVLNSRDTIRGALDSVRAQQGAEVEHIVADGASKDGTLEILRSRRGDLASLVSEPDLGYYDALNKAMGRAHHDIIGILNDDDRYAHEGVLARVAEAFQSPDVDLVYGDLIYVRRGPPDRVVRYWRSGEYSRSRLRWGWMPPHPTVFFRRRLLEQVQGYDLSYRIAGDYDFLLRLLKAGARSVYVPEVLVSMSTGGVSNCCVGNIALKSLEDYRAMRRNHVGGVLTLLAKNLRKVPQLLVRLKRLTRAVTA